MTTFNVALIDNGNADQVPERLTGLNKHVEFVHTKILIIDAFSADPIVITGSGNFSSVSLLMWKGWPRRTCACCSWAALFGFTTTQDRAICE